jgi:hypothetical protein
MSYNGRHEKIMHVGVSSHIFVLCDDMCVRAVKN